VASTIKRLAEVFADERARLEREWAKGDNGSTEDLRQALRKYRSFFFRFAGCLNRAVNAGRGAPGQADQKVT
jgi:hypothetical protein